MKLICIAAMALLFHSCNRKMGATASIVTPSSYTDANGNKILLGIHPKEDLEQAPFATWYNKNYSDYNIDSVTAGALPPLVKNKSFEIFMGTWCGDSKREVPRMLKLLSYAGVPPAKVKLIMVDNRDSVYKQSPGHEEQGKSIHRVPTLLVYDGKKEMNRLVEYPVVSLEKDLLSILTASPYQPNYKGAAYLLRLSKEKKPTDIVKDSTGVAEQLKSLVRNSAELNSLGYVWMSAGEMDKALLAFELNAVMFPNTVNVYDSLGEINAKMNNKEAARKYYNKVIGMQPGHTNAIKKLAQLQ